MLTLVKNALTLYCRVMFMSKGKTSMEHFVVGNVVAAHVDVEESLQTIASRQSPSIHITIRSLEWTDAGKQMIREANFSSYANVFINHRYDIYFPNDNKTVKHCVADGLDDVALIAPILEPLVGCHIGFSCQDIISGH